MMGKSYLIRGMVFWTSYRMELGMDIIYIDFSNAFDKSWDRDFAPQISWSQHPRKSYLWLAEYLDPANKKEAVVVHGRTSDL